MTNHDHDQVPPAARMPGRAAVLEAPAGPARAALLRDWLDQARAAGYRTVYASGDPDEHGVWAGLQPVLEAVLPHARARAPQLVARHSYELCVVLPRLRRELEVANPCLTDTASGEEKVRNYANDRAYRSLHGLIEFLDEWSQINTEPGPGWAIACDAFDRTTTLVQRFFGELLRRRGRQLKLALLLSVAPGALEPLPAFFEPQQVLPRRRLASPAGGGVPLEPDEAGRLAAALEARVGADRIEWAVHIPRLVHLWQRSNTPERSLLWLVRALAVYNHDGLYEIAVRFAPAIEANLELMRARDPELHAMAVLHLLFSYVALGRAEEALRLVQGAGLETIDDRQVRVDLHYDLGMLYARFLPTRDLERAEAHLNAALQLVPQLDVAPARQHFLRVFNRNGLAYVRFRQGRAGEALELCESGLHELDAALPPEQHRLHRSVLLYNAAQVLSALDRRDEAIASLSRAMDMDPNYSEYYLERGGLHLKCERFAEAEQDLRRAIELSPPYAEAWTDLGQCYRAAGRMDEAVAAYDRALDLDPHVGLARVGRAEALLELGALEAAVADYTAALEREPDQPLVLAGRAVAHFEAGRLAAALADLDRAITLAPEVAELYHNRATALCALGRQAAAQRDLEHYLQLCPAASDRATVERQLAELGATRAAA